MLSRPSVLCRSGYFSHILVEGPLGVVAVSGQPRVPHGAFRVLVFTFEELEVKLHLLRSDRIMAAASF